MTYARLAPKLWLFSFALAFAAGCMDGEEMDEGGGNLTAMNEMCMSGTEWVGGEFESPQMHPGKDCLGCHQSLAEAEEVTLAGTVYEGPNEPDDCFGIEGVTLQLTDANGGTHEIISNAAGNFVFEGAAIATPYTAKLMYEGRERAMATPQTVLSCNSCHTQDGLNGAPGRILVP